MCISWPLILSFVYLIYVVTGGSPLYLSVRYTAFLAAQMLRAHYRPAPSPHAD